jgi:hypothetical protein
VEIFRLLCVEKLRPGLGVHMGFGLDSKNIMGLSCSLVPIGEALACMLVKSYEQN